MASFQLRNVPDDLYEEIARRAKNEDRTIPQQTLSMLKISALDLKRHKERRARIIEEARNTNWPPITFDVVEEIRKDRER